MKFIRFLFACIGCTLFVSMVHGGGPANFMMTASVAGRQIEGRPLLWDQRDMNLLGRDGVLYTFPNKEAENARRTSAAFRSYTISEMQSRLREEFGHRFEVSTTQHFVVVHPSGPRSEWGERMESLYRELILSMRVRGIQTSEPDVPLVAVVFHNRDQYFAYARAKGHKLVAETLGHYESQSNRVLLYDDGRTEENLGTIVHEATHQTAYNVGVHRRFAEQPAWLVEGLAMMYETPGVREAWSIQTRKRRINEGRLRNFLAKLDGRPANMIGRLVTSDQLFRTDPVTAYAESWMLSFYLYETRSQDYSRYLARVAARPAFSLYPAKERYADFRAEFGDDLTVLDGQMLRFVEDLKN